MIFYQLAVKIKKLHARAREASKNIFRSSKWAGVRKQFLIKNDECAACEGTTHLQVHHMKPFHLHPDLELDENNFIVLCMGTWDCHLRLGHGDSFKCYNPNVKIDAMKFRISSKSERESLLEEVKLNRAEV